MGTNEGKGTNEAMGNEWEALEMKRYLGFVFFEVVGHELWLVVDRQHDFLDADLVDFMVNQMNVQKEM